MRAEQRRWIVINAIAATAVINVALNALPAWLAARGLDEVPVWSVPFAETGVYTDTLGTLLILPFVTTLLCTTAVWRERRRSAWPRLRGLPAALAALPRSRPSRGCALAAATFALVAPAAALVLAVSGVDAFAATTFVVYKTCLGVALGLVVTPLIALRAMADRLG